ncbi:iron uptake transporter deferrochelatase/peroxidase subunit [Macrococcus capreoli]|uniref:iron uptake transporter deferrochelatase/peroxidase subunit n=1 Tax=Macrococcus capreoli TaxID=2982690 RepID=UPI003F505BD1
MTNNNNMSRRDFLKIASIGGAGVVVGSTGLGTSLLAINHFGKDNKHTKHKVNFYGKYQSGIISDVQKHVYFVVLELHSTEVNEVKEMFKQWTAHSIKLMNGDLIAPLTNNTMLPTIDTGEAKGLDAARLTLTYGVSPTFFDKLKITEKRPKDLKDLPHFPKDQLDDKFTGGDIVIQACSDDPQVNFHAIRNLIRASSGIVTMKWAQTGFNSFEEKDGKVQTPRNLFSFKDGTGNPKAHEQDALDQYIFSNSGWEKNGSYLVVRKIQMHLETWDRTALEDQEATFGRHRDSGAPLGKKNEFDTVNIEEKDKEGNYVIPEDSHVHLAKKAKTKMLRRSFSYTNGVNEQTGAFDAGLIFVSYQKSPEQFTRIQNMLGRIDRMNEYITHRGSGVFLVFPGIKEGGYIGETLFNSI